MKLVIFIIFLIWLYNYWRFTGKRSSCKKMVEVTEQRYAQLHTNQSAIDLATAYMNAQRYADAYVLFDGIISDRISARDIRLNMEFCQKPLPWSKGLKNHRNISYWHNFMLVRFGARRVNLMSEEAVFAFDNYIVRNEEKKINYGSNIGKT